MDKEGFFFPTVDVGVYIEKSVKNSQICEKEYVFQPLKLYYVFRV